MWGNVAWGPGWCSEAEKEERLFTNRSNQSGDDMKDEVRTDDDFYAWSNWRTSKARLWRLRQPAPRPELVPQRWPCKRVWITLTACWPAVAGRPMQQLYDDNTAHLCSDYWLQSIYQELLHSWSRNNATGTGEKNRPSNGLARISAHLGSCCVLV